MKIVDKKTRKAIEKSLRKVIRKHAPAIAAGLASGLASSLATLASTEAAGRGGKSNLGVIAESIQSALTGQPEKPARDVGVEKKRRERSETPTQPREATAH
jgi:hypothetical protein